MIFPTCMLAYVPLAWALINTARVQAYSSIIVVLQCHL